MKIVGVIDSYPIHPRLKKICELYSKSSSPYYIAWNRENKRKSTLQNEIVYYRESQYGNKIKKILVVPKYRSFIKKEIRFLEPDIIICRNWQMLLLIVSITRKCKIVYDVPDMPNSIIGKMIEKILLKYTSEVILASRFFVTFYKNQNTVLLENRPRRASTQLLNKKSDSRVRLTFLGKIRYLDVLKKISEVCSNYSDQVTFTIYGDGPDYNSLLSFIDDNKYDNIYVRGRYEENDIPKIYSQTDVVWAAYPSRLFNVKYAISNKYFETRVYNTPGIFSKNTKLGVLVEQENIGFTVDPDSFENIDSTINKIIFDKSKLIKMERNLQLIEEELFWEEYSVE